MNKIDSIRSSGYTQFPDFVEGEEKVSLLAKQTLESQGNGDMVLTKVRSWVYMFIDFVGGGRQLGAAVESTSHLAHVSHAVSQVASATVPVGLLITGPIVIGTGVIWTIPDAVSARKAAVEELKNAPNKEMLREAKHAVQIANLGIANNVLYTSMGVSQTATGAVLMLTPQTAHLFHYAPLLSGSAAATALTASNVGLGAIYVLRGGVMLVRSTKNYLLVKEFRDDFNKVLDTDEIDDAIAFVQEHEVKGAAYFSLKTRIRFF